ALTGAHAHRDTSRRVRVNRSRSRSDGGARRDGDMDHTLASRPGDETERLESLERVLKGLCLSARLVAAANVEAEARRMKRGVRVFDVSTIQQRSVLLVVHRRGNSERSLGAAELSDMRREVLEE